MKNIIEFEIIASLIVVVCTTTACSGKKDNNNSLAGLNVAVNANTAPTLWKDVKYGMSFDEVKKMYPTSEIIQSAEEADNVDILDFDGVVIQDEDFSVRFVFENKQLIEVGLVTKKEFMGGRAKTLFDGLKEELSQKYGSPVEEKSSRNGLIYRITQIFWNAQGIIVELFYESAITTEYASTLYVAYSVGTIEIEDNL